jgi:hypothetical protein
MKSGKCQFCNRVHLDSLLDGFGGHVKGYAGSEGKYAFICLLHIFQYALINAHPLGTLQKWTTGFIGMIRLHIVTMKDAVSLALMGWRVDTGTMIASRDCYSLQGLDKCLNRLSKHTVIFFYPLGSVNPYQGKNNKRGYSALCYWYVNTMYKMGSPYLKNWDMDIARDFREATIRNGKNVGIAEYMDNAKMSEYLESIGIG